MNTPTNTENRMDIAAKAQELFATVIERRARTGEEEHMQAHLIAPDGVTVVAGLSGLPSPGLRRQVLRFAIRQAGADAVIVIFEAWMASCPPGGRSQLPADLSLAPGRISVLVCCYEHRGGAGALRAAISEAGAVGEVEDTPGFTGPLTGLLPLWD